MADDVPSRRRRRSFYLILSIGMAGVIGFAGLGLWQLERLAWKNDLVASVTSRSMSAPVDLNDTDWTTLKPENAVYQRVNVTGRYGQQSSLVQAVTALGGGFWVMTPLNLADGRTVLVNRGFVAQSLRDAPPQAVEGEVRVTGLLRETEPDGGFLRTNDPAANRWYSRDVTAIGAADQLTNLAPFFVDADEVAGDTVQGGLTVLSFSNNHLIYALTWFALAAILGGGLVWLVMDARRKTE